MSIGGLFMFYAAIVLVLTIKASFTGVISGDEKDLLGFFIIMLNIESLKCKIEDKKRVSK